MTKFLITYLCHLENGRKLYATAVAEDPVEWLIETQTERPMCSFILINAQPMTEEQAARWLALESE